MQQRTVSTMQPITGQTPGAAASLIISRLSVPVIQRIDGYMNGADTSTQYWLMFFAGTTVPANATAPLFELQIVGKNGFSWDFAAQGGLDFQKMLPLQAGTLGLIIAISSTSATLTASVATMDIAITVNEPFLPNAGQSVSGDLTTARNNLTVWSNPQSVRLGLLHLDVTNTDGGATQYLHIYPVAPSAGDVPAASFPVTNGGSISQDFGTLGLSPFRTSTVTPTTNYNGCYFYVSTTAASYTAPSGNHWTMRGIYK